MVQENNLLKHETETRTGENSLSLSHIPSTRAQKSASQAADTLLWANYNKTYQGVGRLGIIWHLCQSDLIKKTSFFFPVRFIWIIAKFSNIPKGLQASRPGSF